MTLDELNKVLRDTVLMIVPSLEVIRHYPNAPRPNVAYASVDITTARVVGFGDSGERQDEPRPDGDLTRKYDPLMDMTASLNFFRTNANAFAALFLGSLVTQQIVEFWNVNGVAYVSRSDARDLTQVVNTSYEERSQIDVVVQAIIEPPTQTIFGVDSVRVIGSIENLTGEVATVDIQGPPD